MEKPRQKALMMDSRLVQNQTVAEITATQENIKFETYQSQKE